MKKFKRLKSNLRRLCASALGLSMAAGLFVYPSSPVSVNASAVPSYAQPYLDKLAQWDILKGDETGDLRANDSITRAEFAAMINRSYGFNELGTLDYSDVPPDSWYADDISIAQHAGYFTGTSDKTANPEDELTREQAMVLLGKSGRLDEIPGEVTEFTDGRDFSNWGKGYAKAAVKQGIVTGYPDGTFKPKSPISRAEMSCLLCKALGTLINTGGTRELGDVYGNVTINSPGTELKNTTIAGDLYISGGLGLGAVTLTNVKVLGRIVIAGGGESESGNDSVVLRNVETPELLADSLSGNYLSVRAEGDTVIDQAYVRSAAFIRDNTSTNYGFKNINLDGSTPGTTYSLAGNLKNVVNRSPSASINVGDGRVESFTMDEDGAGSSLNLDYNATVNNLNLDTGTPITGSGDVQSIIINSNGSTSDILPDNIELRPGITADINGLEMNSQTAQESSADPRLLSGYPDASAIAPTSFDASFSVNKAGTIYWAVSAIADGSISEDELVNPSSYNPKALKSGNIKADDSSTVYTFKVSGLTKGGSYYLSAVLVDTRGLHSPVKVISLETPDDSTPAFATGYPVISKVTNVSGQANVMATKSCDLYYALYESGSAAPTPDDFKNGRVSESLGHGVIPLIKNQPDLFKANDRDLEELASYDLYLWLNDADNAKSSAVRKLTFKTADKTPPVYTVGFTVNKWQNTSLGATATINEKGTIFWVIVEEGTPYPVRPGKTEPEDLDSDFARIQVAAGAGGLKAGSTSMTANKSATINMTGLEAESGYDIYYVAVDSSGNYSGEVKKATDHTLDTREPTVEQEFTLESGNPPKPYANTDIKIIFSETVYYIDRAEDKSYSLLSLYQEASKKEATEDDKKLFAEALRNCIIMYDHTEVGTAKKALERNKETDPEDKWGMQDDWIIDYRNVTIKKDGKKLVVTFPTTDDINPRSALNMKNDSKYYFQLVNLEDFSHNSIKGGLINLDEFTTIPAQVAITEYEEAIVRIPVIKDEDTTPENVDVDLVFSLTPLESTKVSDSVRWDMLLWPNASCKFEVYEKVGENWKKTKNDGWVTVTNSQFIGQSVNKSLKEENPLPALSSLKGKNDYAIRFTEMEGTPRIIQDKDGKITDEPWKTWNKSVEMRVSVITGTSPNLSNLAKATINDETFKEAQTKYGIANIGSPDDFSLLARFTDTKAPEFAPGYPKITPGDKAAAMEVRLTRADCKVYYVVAPFGKIETKKTDGSVAALKDITEAHTRDIDVDYTEKERLKLSEPHYLDIVNADQYYNQNTQIIPGQANVGSSAIPIDVNGLEPNTDYVAYFVLKGVGEESYSREVEVFKFKTTELNRPSLYLQAQNPTVMITSNMSTEVSYIVVPNIETALGQLNNPFYNYVPEDKRDTVISKYGKGYTVIDAMSNYEKTDKGLDISIFDEYVDPKETETFANIIRSASGAAFADYIFNGELTITVPPGGSKKTEYVPYEKISGMSPLTNYYLVAVGRSTASGQVSGDSFGAAYPVTAYDNEPPKIESVQGAIVDTKKGNIKKGTIITVVFSEPLYNIKGDQRLPVTLYNWNKDKPKQKGAISINELLIPSANVELAEEYLTNDINDTNAAKQFTFRVTTGTRNFTIGIGGPLGDINGNNITSGIEINIRSRRLAEPDPITNEQYEDDPVITITPSDWIKEAKK